MQGISDIQNVSKQNFTQDARLVFILASVSHASDRDFSSILVEAKEKKSANFVSSDTEVNRSSKKGK